MKECKSAQVQHLESSRNVHDGFRQAGRVNPHSPPSINPAEHFLCCLQGQRLRPGQPGGTLTRPAGRLLGCSRHGNRSLGGTGLRVLTNPADSATAGVPAAGQTQLCVGPSTGWRAGLNCSFPDNERIQLQLAQAEAWGPSGFQPPLFAGGQSARRDMGVWSVSSAHAAPSQLKGTESLHKPCR